jgi:hypothetical protein
MSPEKCALRLPDHSLPRYIVPAFVVIYCEESNLKKLLIDLAAEIPLSLAAAAHRLPSLREDRPVNPATVLRWVVKGTLLPDGSRLRLPAVKVAGRWCTTVEALNSYVTDITAAALPTSTMATPRTPTQRRRSSERADEALEAKGV